MINPEIDSILDELKQKVDNFKVNSVVSTNLLLGDDSVLDKVELSIVIPTFNRPDTFKKALMSVYNQEGFDNVCLVVIDNSDKNDESVKENTNLIKGLNCKNILYYINEKNLGMVGNWNRAIEIVKSKYIAFLHDDDLVKEDYIKEIKKCILNAEKYSNDKVGVIKVKTNVFFNENDFTKMKLNNKNRGGIINVTNKDFLVGHIHVSNPPTCGIVFSRKALLECGGFNASLYPSMDQVMGVQMFSLGYMGFISEDVLGYYRFAVNESLKSETMKGFCKMDYIICSYSSSLDTNLTKYWKRFGKFSYIANIKYYFEFARENGNNLPYNYFDDYGFYTLGNRIGALLVLTIWNIYQKNKFKKIIY